MLTADQIIVDPEFESHIAPLSGEEFEQLQKNIMEEGCRDALVVWKGENILLDGHNRYLICDDKKLPFNTIEKEFESRDDALDWVVRNQLGRRNVTPEQKSYLRGKLYEREKKRKEDNLRQAQAKKAPEVPVKKEHIITPLQASKGCTVCGFHKYTDDGAIFCNDLEERMNEADDGTKCSEWFVPEKKASSSGKTEDTDTEPIVPNRHNGDSSVRTVDRLAEEFRVGTKTIERDAEFARATDTIAENVGPDARRTILSREKGLTKTDVKTIADLPADKQKEILSKDRTEIREAVKEAHLKQVEEHEQLEEDDGEEDTGRLVESVSELISEGLRFKCIYIAPTWDAKTQTQLYNLPIMDLLEDDACVHLLVDPKNLFTAMTVFNAWGLEYVDCLAWTWRAASQSDYWQHSHEIILLGVKGKPEFSALNFRSWRTEAEPASKSEAGVRELLGKVSQEPRLQVFGKKTVRGWVLVKG